jgi:hypothetical protein
LVITSNPIPLESLGKNIVVGIKMKKLLCLLLICFPSMVMAGEPSAIAAKEISHLFECLNFSTCEFNRNGSWYTPDNAAKHLNRKYEFLLRRNLVCSAEDFIERAATESSMSGKPYWVRCGNSSPVTSNSWLRKNLLNIAVIMQ